MSGVNSEFKLEKRDGQIALIFNNGGLDRATEAIIEHMGQKLVEDEENITRAISIALQLYHEWKHPEVDIMNVLYKIHQRIEQEEGGLDDSPIVG